jgi:IS5 family transposase
MTLLQRWHGLSDEKTEFACQDRVSFKRFLGLGITAKVPDATTLENFRHDLESVGLDERLLRTLDTFFKQRGLLMQASTMVDATFVKGNCKAAYDEDLKPTPEEQSDIDAEAGFKGLGYSATTNVDKGTKLIRKVVVGSARAHDSQYRTYARC